MELRSFYHSLRLNWQQDPTLLVEPWQVEDYRQITLEALFQRLNLQGILLDKHAFLTLADQVDTPEDLTDLLLENREADTTSHDQVYLLVFELWRRLVPEKPSLTIFCDELDHQISLYDAEQIANPETIEDTLANLQVILEEHADEGGDPVDLFETIGQGCAYDVESFLYDFIRDQIDGDNLSYASELLEAFSDYVSDALWFDFLKVRILFNTDPVSANSALQNLLKEAIHKKDLEFQLEILSFLVLAGNQKVFSSFATKTVPLLVSEADFQDLLNICMDFYRRLDDENREQLVQKLLTKRSGRDLDQPIDQNDPDIAEIFAIVESRLNAID